MANARNSSAAAVMGQQVVPPAVPTDPTKQSLPRATTAELAALGAAVNTVDKFAGKAVINTTAGTIVTANGAAAGDTWLALAGTVAHTPI